MLTKQNTSKDKHDDVTVQQHKMNLKIIIVVKGAAIGAGTAGVAGAAGAMGVSKAKKHSNDAQNRSNSGKVNNSTEDKASEDKSKEHHNGKKGAAIGAGTAGLAGGAARIVLLPLQNHMPLIMQVKTMMNMTITTEIKNVKRWHGQSIVTINCSCTNYRCISDIWRHGINTIIIMVQKKIKSRIQIKIMLMKVKIKTHLKTLLKINQNLQTVINQKMIKTKRLKDESDNDQNNANQANNQAQNNQNQQQANQNQQQQQQRQRWWPKTYSEWSEKTYTVSYSI